MADIELMITCGGAPLVIEGKIGDHKLFYRSRHGRWRIEIDDAEVSFGTDENGQDSQEASEALRLIGKHCFRQIWDCYNIREEERFQI